MSLVRFLAHYVRRYTVWAGVALVAIVLFAAATVGIVALIEPIFGEVLLAGDQMPGIAGIALDLPAEAPSPDPAVAEGAGESSWFDELRDDLDVSGHLDSSYESLKRRWNIGPQEVVYFVPLLFVGIFLLRSLADFLAGYSFQHIGLGVTTDIRNALYRRILEQSSRFYAEHPSGELVARVINDVALMQSAVSNRLLDLVQQSITLVFLVAMLLSTHLKLALISLIVAPLLVIPIVRFGKGMRRTSHRSQERMADLASLMAEAVRGHRVVKAFGMEDFEYGRFKQATGRHLKVNLRAQRLAHLSSPVVESLAVVGAAALLIYAGRAIRGGELTTAELIKFLTTLLMMYDPIRKLNKVNLILQEAGAAVQRVKGIMEVPNPIRQHAGSVTKERVETALRFENVVFAYEEDDREQRPVLSGINLTIESGEIIALVGPSGAGKSTLVNLLPRFFDPVEGRLTLDGVDIRQLDLDNLRSLIGVVTQDTVLFDDTVRANIAYGRADLPQEDVEKAAEAAFADEFIRQLPEGYDTRIGESGLKLSGGQRQRLAIARALLKNAPILILDEATSHLDTQSEALVQKALYNLMQGRTTLVIAHRLSTVKKANRIVVMEAGRVVEQGTHEELMARGGSYKHLHDLQFQST